MYSVDTIKYRKTSGALTVEIYAPKMSKVKLLLEKIANHLQLEISLEERSNGFLRGKIITAHINTQTSDVPLIKTLVSRNTRLR